MLNKYGLGAANVEQIQTFSCSAALRLKGPRKYSSSSARLSPAILDAPLRTISTWGLKGLPVVLFRNPGSNPPLPNPLFPEKFSGFALKMLFCAPKGACSANLTLAMRIDALQKISDSALNL